MIEGIYLFLTALDSLRQPEGSGGRCLTSAAFSMTASCPRAYWKVDISRALGRDTQAVTAPAQTPGMSDVTAMARGQVAASRSDPQEVAEHVAAGGSPFDYVEPPDWFSFSAFDMFERCPRQYALRYLCRLEEKQTRPAADFGSAAHAAFEQFTRERRERSASDEAPPDREDLGRFFEAAWARSPLSGEVDAVAWRARAQPMLDRFWAAESAEPVGAIDTVCEEARFRLCLELDPENQVAVSGFIDRIDRLPSGSVELIDYKTGDVWRPEDVESSLQLSIYALGCRDALGLGRPERVTLDFVEHGRRFSAERTDAALDGVRQGLVLRAREIRGSGFAPTPGSRACGWCEFAPICSAGERQTCERPLGE
jgi:RecB family exonuclease